MLVACGLLLVACCLRVGQGGALIQQESLNVLMFERESGKLAAKNDKEGGIDSSRGSEE